MRAAPPADAEVRSSVRLLAPTSMSGRCSVKTTGQLERETFPDFHVPVSLERRGCRSGWSGWWAKW